MAGSRDRSRVPPHGSTGRTLNPKYTKAKSNRQIHWNSVFEDLKAGSKAAFERGKKKANIYNRRKIRGGKCVRSHQEQSVFSRITLLGPDNCNCGFSPQQAENLRHRPASLRKRTPKQNKQVEKRLILLHLLLFLRYFGDFSDNPQNKKQNFYVHCQ